MSENNDYPTKNITVEMSSRNTNISVAHPNNPQNRLHLERENSPVIITGFSNCTRNTNANNTSSTTSNGVSSTLALTTGNQHASNCPEYNWQATKTTVKERFAFVFNTETLCDVHFIVGRDNTRQHIPAHKFVLSVGSAVFDAMFNGTLATHAEEIDLPDVEPAAFLALLK